LQFELFLRETVFALKKKLSSFSSISLETYLTSQIVALLGYPASGHKNIFAVAHRVP